MTCICLSKEFMKKYILSSSLLFMSLVPFLSIQGCALVGPDYVAQETISPEEWSVKSGYGLSEEAIDPELLAKWWTVFNDPFLTDLVGKAINNNLDLKQARAKVTEAMARRGIEKAGLFPSLDAEAAYKKSKSAENSAGMETTRNSYSVGLDSGWEIDLFGGIRRSIEAADADLDASKEDLRDVLVSLTAEVALNYLDVRTLQNRLYVAEKNVASQQTTYELTQSMFTAGLSNELALQQARYTLENSRSQIPVMRQGLEEAKNRIAVLCGVFPGGVHEMLDQIKPLPEAPLSVVIGVPAETLRRRPDVRSAERKLAAQTARIGVVKADLYPKFRLTGTIGFEAMESSALLNLSSSVWSIGPSISWNLFDAGAIRQNIVVQSALQEQYLLAYEAAVLGALEEVENALTSYVEEELRKEHLAAAVDAAQKAELLSKDQFKAGLVDFTTVLEAQRSLFTFEDQLAESRGSVMLNLVRLYKTLGGGWDSSFN